MPPRSYLAIDLGVVEDKKHGLDLFSILEWLRNSPSARGEREISCQEIQHPKEWEKKEEGHFPSCSNRTTSLLLQDQEGKRNLDFGEKIQEVEAHQENVLNLAYSYSQEEQGEDETLALQIVPFTKEFPFPTP